MRSKSDKDKNQPSNVGKEAVFGGARDHSSHGIQYRVGFLGLPSSWLGPRWVRKVEYNAENLGRLKSLGFNVMPVNLLWTRQDDEVYCLEELIELTAEQQEEFPQPVPLACRTGDENRIRRLDTLRKRIALCRDAGMRTLMIVAQPHNNHGNYGDNPPNCISDEKTVRRHLLMLEKLALELPGLNDLMMYTYDGPAWLCSEFGACPRCNGIPLHKRLPQFVSALAEAWHKLSSGGRLWWEPWELSAGQSLACIETINTEGLGLVMHCNSAETMATMPADRWFKNMCAIAKQRGIPVMVQYFLSGYSEETEPLTSLSHPLVTLRGLKALAAVSGVVGVKEYIGLDPDHEDPNLRMTGLFFNNPEISEDEALNELAKPYGKAADGMIRFWRLTSEAMELFPWETSWHIREIGYSRTDHGLSAAFIRAMNWKYCPTPSWSSTRQSTFLRIEPAYPPHPWLFEDIQLRCELAAERMRRAISLGREISSNVPNELSGHFAMNLDDLGRFCRRALAYAYHLRETNLAVLLRKALNDTNQSLADSLTRELTGVMQSDLDNFRTEAATPNPWKIKEFANSLDRDGHDIMEEWPTSWPEMETALAVLREDVDRFLNTYLNDVPTSKWRGGMFSMTSR